MTELVPHSRPTLGEEEARAVHDVVLSGQVAQGPQVARFEEELADYVGVGHGVAVSSGTSALALALRALGVGEGDEVAIPSYSSVLPPWWWMWIPRPGIWTRTTSDAGSGGGLRR